MSFINRKTPTAFQARIDSLQRERELIQTNMKEAIAARTEAMAQLAAEVKAITALNARL